MKAGTIGIRIGIKWSCKQTSGFESCCSKPLHLRFHRGGTEERIRTSDTRFDETQSGGVAFIRQISRSVVVAASRPLHCPSRVAWCRVSSSLRGAELGAIHAARQYHLMWRGVGERRTPVGPIVCRAFGASGGLEVHGTARGRQGVDVLRPCRIRIGTRGTGSRPHASRGARPPSVPASTSLCPMSSVLIQRCCPSVSPMKKPSSTSSGSVKCRCSSSQSASSGSRRPR